MSGVSAATAGALFVAALSTLGDLIWAAWIPRHRPIYGLAHGTLLFLAVGAYLGAVARRPAVGALGGAAIGFLAAGSFYAFAPLAGYSVMFASYFAVWIALALLVRGLSHARPRETALEPPRQHGLNASAREIVVRGIVAAVASGAAFYAVSGIWFPFRPRGWDYAVHFVSWTIAYLPGLLALLAPLPGRRAGPVAGSRAVEGVRTGEGGSRAR